MSCPECTTAQENHAYRLFNPLCIHCGARLVQMLGTLSIGKAERSKRRSAVLDDWEMHGHDRAQIRSLAMGALALDGRAEATVFDPLKSKKRGKKHDHK